MIKPVWLTIIACLMPLTCFAQDVNLREERRIQQMQAALAPAPPDAGLAATDAEVLAALGLTSSVSPVLTRVGNGAAFATFPGLGVITPVTGTRFVALSSGVAGTTSPEPGTDFSPVGVTGDRAELKVTLQVPSGVSRIGFWYRFMSAEFPEFVGSEYNDAFRVVVTTGAGSNQAASATVNTTVFTPASNANAAGSGYLIFDGSGNPDAGLTDWVPASIPVTSGTVTVTFSIEDVGDGIYDSQVLISALSLSQLETIDTYPSFLSATTTGVTTDSRRLSSGGAPVRGIAADGASIALLRFTPPASGTVRFTILNAGEDDGKLLSINGGVPVTDLVVPTVSNDLGVRALALYLAPANFDKPGYTASAERNIQIRVSTGSGASATNADFNIAIVRPPVLFLHGLWSFDGMWNPFSLLADPRFVGRTYQADYRVTNASSFSTNGGLFGTWIANALRKLRLDRIAATRVDLVGHSMGGVLARRHGASATYRRTGNYQKGDFNRVITLNSPHFGSPWANLLLSLSQHAVFGDIVVRGMSIANMPVDQGAIQDLSEGSSALAAIGTANVAGHAVGGTGGSDLVESLGHAGTLANLASLIVVEPTLRVALKTMATVAGFIGLADSLLFGGRQHDGIVPLDSEYGGIASVARSTVTGIQSIHTNVGSSGAYGQLVAGLVTTSPTSSSFSSFPAGGGNDAPVLSPPPKVVMAAATEGLTLQPSATTVQVGSTVTFTVTANAGHSVSSVILVAPEGFTNDDAAPFLMSLTIPNSNLGSYRVTAAAKSSTGVALVSNTVTLTLTTSATVSSVVADPRDVLFSAVGAKIKLNARAIYSDGVTRAVDAQPGAVFSSSNTGVATVLADGTITAVARGYATVKITLGGQEDSVLVTVNPNAEDPPPVANAGPDIGVSPGTSVTLTGSASSVPQGLTANYSWSQASGPATITLSNPSSATPSFATSTAGTYVFSLIVSAGLLESVPDNVVVVVGGATAPTILAAPQRTTVNPGETATFTVSAVGVPTPTFEWRKNATAIPGANGTSLTVANAQASDAGMYSVRVVNASGEVTSSAVALSIRSVFTDASPTAGVSTIKAVHVTELRNAVAALRQQCGLDVVSYTDPDVVAGLTVVNRLHVVEIRTALDQVYDCLGLTRPAYTDASLPAQAVIKVTHLTELRAAIHGIQ